MSGITDYGVRTALDYASGTADRNGETLDMAGFGGVLLVVKFAAIAAGSVLSVKAQQGTESDLSDAADLKDTGITVADDDDNQIVVLDIKRPSKPYVRVVVDKDGENETAESAVYVLYDPLTQPTVVDVADAVTGEHHLSPVEGDA